MATLPRGGRGSALWSLRLGLVENVLFVLAVALVLVVMLQQTGYGAIIVGKAELSSGNLWIEGTAIPVRTITVDGVAMGTSGGDGRFWIERSGFVAPADCTVEIKAGSAAPASATLAGCTVSTPPSAP
jgi:hypothetical protein